MQILIMQLVNVQYEALALHITDEHFPKKILVGLIVMYCITCRNVRPPCKKWTALIMSITHLESGVQCLLKPTIPFSVTLANKTANTAKGYHQHGIKERHG